MADPSAHSLKRGDLVTVEGMVTGVDNEIIT